LLAFQIQAKISINNGVQLVSLPFKDSTNKTDSSDQSSELYILEQKIRALQNNRRTLLRQKYDFEKSLAEFTKELKKIKKVPLILGQIEEVYPEEEKVIVKSSTGPSFLVSYASEINKDNLKPGTSVALNQRNYSIIELIQDQSDPYITQMEIDLKPTVSFSQIGGLELQIQELREAIELPLVNPAIFKDIGIDPPRGVLLYGPPGSGKTLVAKAVAHHTNAAFISVVGSALVQKYIGEGTRIVKELFEFAQKKSPTIIFIDELDAIGSRRELTTSGDLEVQRTLMELLAQMDGFSPYMNVKVIGATNRPDILDPALIRAGRFDKHIEIPNPDLAGRSQIFKIYLTNMSIKHTPSELDLLAEMTENYNGSMIKSICTDAGMNVIRRNEDKVFVSDLIEAIQKNQLKTIKSDLKSESPLSYS
jgi:proteasome regulatory subunit